MGIPATHRRRRQRGASLLEVLMATGVAGLLGSAGMIGLRPPALSLAQREVEGSFHQAFMLARTSGRDVELSLSGSEDLGHLPVRLPRNVAWGKPASVPLPPDMDAPLVAAQRGEARARITVTPRHTATAAVWFLNDGQDVLCVRVSDQGQLRLLRWRHQARVWARV